VSRLPRCLFTGTGVFFTGMVVRLVCVPLCVRVSRVSRVCPGSPRCLFTGPGSPRCLFTGSELGKPLGAEPSVETVVE